MVDEGVFEVEGQMILGYEKPKPVEPEIYTVKRGDTLWDISSEHFQNPWYWPKIWADNPEVSNPHWIYPGNQLRLHLGAEEMPGEVELLTGGENIGVEAVVMRDEPLSASALVRVVGPYRIGGPQLRKDAVRVLKQVIATDEEIEQMGVIDGAETEREMLTHLDRVYVKFTEDQPAPGEQLGIFRVLRPLLHPVSGAEIGKVVKVLGVFTVEGQRQDELFTGFITKVLDVIERGDLVGPMMEFDLYVSPKPNETEVDGIVLGSEVADVTMLGENHIVFLDRGLDAGVKVGNQFVVLQQGDPLRSSLAGIETPDEEIGLILVVDARAGSSTGVVLRSLREVAPGDSVRMPKAGE